MPQPKKHLNYDQLDALLQFKVSLEYCADYLGVSSDTIMRRLREDHDMSFHEYKKLKNDRTAVRLQQKIVEKALSGDNTALIFSLKNMASWSDRVESKVETTQEIIISSDEQDL